MGTLLKLTEAFTAPTGRVVKPDMVLPPELGALILLDGGHSAGGFGVGMPAQATYFPNVAEADALALIGSGTTQTLGGQLLIGGAEWAGAAGERTSKGGLHVAVRQDALGLSNGAVVDLGSAIDGYIVANPTHDYYVSLWERVTRAGQVALVPPLPSLAIVTFSGSATGNYLAIFDQVNSNPTISPPRLGARTAGVPPNTDGDIFRSIGVSQITGAFTGGVATSVIPWGSMGAWAGLLSATPAASLSRIFYRMYIEDLTVSGRTYAEVDAIDYSLWQEAFAEGGRFYDDTWTEPAVLAGA